MTRLLNRPLSATCENARFSKLWACQSWPTIPSQFVKEVHQRNVAEIVAPGIQHVQSWLKEGCAHLELVVGAELSRQWPVPHPHFLHVCTGATPVMAPDPSIQTFFITTFSSHFSSARVNICSSDVCNNCKSLLPYSNLFCNNLQQPFQLQKSKHLSWECLQQLQEYKATYVATFKVFYHIQISEGVLVLRLLS